MYLQCLNLFLSFIGGIDLNYQMLFDASQTYFKSQATKPLAFRKQKLKSLKKILSPMKKRYIKH